MGHQGRGAPLRRPDAGRPAPPVHRDPGVQERRSPRRRAGRCCSTRATTTSRGLAWSGRGKVQARRRVGRRRAQLAHGAARRPGAAQVPDALQHRLGRGTASRRILQSRAIDETGYVQPTIRQLRAVRGTRSIYHNNAIQSWQVQESGRGEQCPAGVSALRCAALAAALRVRRRRAGAAERFPGIGRAATPAEVAAWDIDVRPDFKGLPPGSGSVAQGQEVWEAKCASLPRRLRRVQRGLQPARRRHHRRTTSRPAASRSLSDPDYPGRTTLMKVADVSTLWDYINRAMPWNAPKSLTHRRGLCRHRLHAEPGDIVPDDFVLSRPQHRRGAEAPAQPQRHDDRRTRCGRATSSAAASPTSRPRPA